MITKFHTFEQYHGRKNIGGTRLRAHWPILKWKEAGPDIGEAGLYKVGDKPDVLIFQKVYNFDLAENFNGIKILDLCDPDFLNWGYPVKRMIEACDAVTCSSEKLAEVVAGFSGDKPVWFIPDCVLDPEKQPKKVHKGDLKSVSWYGYCDNFPALDSAVPALVKRNLDLLVVGTAPYVAQSNMKVRFRDYPWGADTWVKDFMRADVVINPKLTHGRFAYKSDNKTTQAWSVGMPVAETEDDFDRFKTAEARQKEGDEKRQWVIDNRDVRVQVKQLKELILSIKK
jgi:hypothetical protein